MIHALLHGVQRNAWQATVLMLLAGSNPISAEDRVRWHNDRGDEIEWSGEIVRFDANELQLTNSAGRTGKLRRDRIFDVEYMRSAGHRAADEWFAKAEYEQAIEAYRSAYRTETRAWIKEELAVGIVRCQMALRQPALAAQVFLAMAADNPQTRFLPAIPLVWSAEAGTNSLQSSAAIWLRDKKQPLAQLIGASWALSGADRAEAEAVLRDLSRSRMEVLRQLAVAQLWRVEVVRAKREELQRWETLWCAMPSELRGGPAAVLGQGWYRVEEFDAAVLAYLQATWHPFTHVPLAEQCREDAARILRETGHADEAKQFERGSLPGKR